MLRFLKSGDRREKTVRAGGRDRLTSSPVTAGEDKARLKTSLKPPRIKSVRPSRVVASGDMAGDVVMSDVLGAIGRRKGLIAMVTLASLLGSLAFVNLVSPRYTAEARLLLENRDTYYSRPEKDGRSSTEAIDPEAVQSQVQVIGSRDLARVVIRKLDLGALPEFDPLLRGIPSYARALILLGIVRDPTLSSPEERVLDSYSNKVSISAVGKSRVIGIEVSTLNPDIASKIANAIAQEYLALQTDAKKQNTQIASSWLNQTIEPLRKQVIEADAKVEAYRSRNNLYLGPNNTTISNQQLSELNTQLSTARASLAEQQAKAQTIREALRTGRIFEVSDVLKDDLIRRLTENRSNLRALYASESKVYLPQHPRLKELTAQIGDLEGQIRSAAERTTRSLENDAKAGVSRLAALATQIESQKKITALANDDDVTLKSLDREAKALRDQLETYQAKAIDANARDTQTGSPADARIVSVALAPSVPSFPKSMPIVTIVTLAGFIVTTFLVVAGELLRMQGAVAIASRPRIDPVLADPVLADPVLADPVVAESPAAEAMQAPRRGGSIEVASSPMHEEREPPLPDHIEEAPAPAIVETMPLAGDMTIRASRIGQGLSPQARMVLQPDSAYARAIRSIAERCATERRHAKAEGHAAALQIAITSVDEGQGATSVAISLSRLLAADGRAILIDLNEASPGLDALISHTDGVGLSDLLEGRAAFGDAIHRDRGSKLHIMPLGLGDGEVVSAQLLPGVLDALRQSYDYLLIDGGVASYLPETIAMGTSIAVLVAVGDKDADETKAAYHSLSAAGIANIAVMFNEADAGFAAGAVANDASMDQPLARA